jgi:predicted lipid-binding transport protein (Tim44 family)
MNRYILIRRLTGPAVLLLIGVLALLHQAGVIEGWWHLFWPLLLILIGVIKLAERAALASEPYPPAPDATYAGYPPYPGAYQQGAYQDAPAQQPAANETSIVPSNRSDIDRNGGGL